MALTPNHRERLSKALLAAFPTYTSLAMLLSFKLNMNLERISRAESLDQVVFRLISWAEEDRARLKDLLPGAVETIPKDDELRAVVEDILSQPEWADEEVFVQPAVEEEEHLTTGELLFRGHPLLGQVFTMRPALLAGAVFVTALVLLVGASLVLDVFSVPCPDGRNFGIVAKPNWLYVYPCLLPLLFAWASLTNIHLCQGLHRVYWRFKVIRIRHSARPKHYLRALSEHLESRRWWPLGLALAMAVVIMVLDTYDLWLGFVRRPFPIFPNSVKPDWDTAFTGFDKLYYVDETFFGPAHCTPTAYPSYWENLTFDIIAYAFQGAAIFLGFFWAFKFLHALYSLSTLLKRSKNEYYLDLMEFDKEKRLGLGPLGKAYNVFLMVTVAYQIFAFLHRLQIIAQWKSEPSAWKYVRVITVGLFDPAIWSNTDFYSFIDWGAFLALVAMSAPVVIICYLPLWKLRKRVKEIKEEKKDKYNALYETAMRRGAPEEAENYSRMLTALEGASVWPNGSATAYWFLMSMMVLLIAGWFPPLLVPLLLVGVAVVLLRIFYDKRH